MMEDSRSLAYECEIEVDSSSTLECNYANSDFQIVGGNCKFYVHKRVLKIYSSYFKRKLERYTNFAEFKIEGVHAKLIESVIWSLYSGVVVTTKDYMKIIYAILRKLEARPRVKRIKNRTRAVVAGEPAKIDNEE